MDTKNTIRFSTDQLLYGVAYYDEYMPYDRLDEDVRMMKEAGINVVRIGVTEWITGMSCRMCVVPSMEVIKEILKSSVVDWWTISLKNDNYYVLETEAQGFFDWVPYDGQLRLQAFSHIANGADSVMYWHWHSLHNACETYWKGLLSHDLKENDTYRAAKVIGAEFAKHSKKLVHLKKDNRVAIMVNNESLTGMRIFSLPDGTTYNQIVHWIYDALFEMNVECDFVPDDAGFELLAKYDHPNWNKYIAATRNEYKNGKAVYIGCMTDEVFVKSLLEDCVKDAGLWSNKQQNNFPIINREGINMEGKKVNYYFNYSSEPVKAVHWAENGVEILGSPSSVDVERNQEVEIEPWGVRIVIS